ncbi:MAG: hypothetical protein ACR2GQ_02720 [Gemmatimonadota bacterium]
METVYVISLVVGGGIALLSAFGDFLDVGTDADLDLDLELDADVDAGLDAGHAGAPSAAIFSLRALVFTLFGFGAVGTALTALGANPTSPVTMALSVLSGLLVGFAVGSFLAYLKRSDTPARAGDATFRGAIGRVTLPIGAAAPGQVVVRRGNREHAIRALPHASAGSDPAAWRQVVVVEMRDGIAYVGPVGHADENLLS